MMLSALLTTKAAVGIAAGAVVLGGAVTTVAVVHTGTVNIPQAATDHPTASPTAAETPDTSQTPDPSATPVGPNAKGPAAFGLCTAFAHGGLSTSSVAYKSLVTAAGTADNIKTYCANIAHPGHPAPQSTTHPTGKPASLPSQATASHPASAPVTHPTDQPSTLPAGPPSPIPSH